MLGSEEDEVNCVQHAVGKVQCVRGDDIVLGEIVLH